MTRSAEPHAAATLSRLRTISTVRPSALYTHVAPWPSRVESRRRALSPAILGPVAAMAVRRHVVALRRANRDQLRVIRYQNGGRRHEQQSRVPRRHWGEAEQTPRTLPNAEP